MLAAQIEREQLCIRGRRGSAIMEKIAPEERCVVDATGRCAKRHTA